MTQPQRFVARLEEPAPPEDKTSGVRQNQLPTYHAYSVDGDVTAPLVYVNYGTPAARVAIVNRPVGVGICGLGSLGKKARRAHHKYTPDFHVRYIIRDVPGSHNEAWIWATFRWIKFGNHKNNFCRRLKNWPIFVDSGSPALYTPATLKGEVSK